jgi:flagellar protein FliO/FliZ
MNDLVGTFWPFVALALVVALIFVAAWVARRLGLGSVIAARGGKRRLAIVEVLPLDGKRRLVLLRRDATEHLVLLGQHEDLLVEAGIAPAANFATVLEGSA